MLIQKQYNKLILVELSFLNRAAAKMYFIIEEAKQAILDFSKGMVPVLSFILFQ